MKITKSECKNIFCALGIIFIIIGLVFSLLHFNMLATFIILSIGILCEIIYKIMSAAILKKMGQAYIREYIFAGIYIVFLGVLWFY